MRVRAAAISGLLPQRPMLGAALSLIVLSHLADLSPAAGGVGHFSAPACAALVPVTAPAIPTFSVPTRVEAVSQAAPAAKKPAVGQVTSPAGFMMPLGRMVTTSSFGVRVHPITGDIRSHDGVDLRAKLEEPVFSVLAGTVISAGRKGGYGNAVEIYHPTNRTTTLYAHLNSIWVERGDRVRKGSAIGGAGTTGISTGVHLHFAVRHNGAYVNPMAVLNNAEIPASTFQIAKISPKAKGVARIATASSRTARSTRIANIQLRSSNVEAVVASAKSVAKLSPRNNNAPRLAKSNAAPKPVVAKVKPDLSGLERKMAEATAAAEKFNYLHQEGVVSRLAAVQKSEEASAATKAYNDARASL